MFAIIKKGKIKGIYLFKIDIKENSKNLIHTKTVYSDELTNDVREKCSKQILNIARDYVSMQEYDKITFEDKVVQVDSKKSKKEQYLAMVGGFALGFILGWIIFDKFYWGIIYGLIFVPIFSGLEVVVTNKRGRKKISNSNSKKHN